MSLDQVMEQTRDAIGRLCFGEPLSIPAMTDYGIKSDRHYRALRDAMLNDYPMTAEQYADLKGVSLEEVKNITAEEHQAVIQEELAKKYVAFEKMRTNGKAITAFVEKYAPEHRGIVFRTPADEMRDLGVDIPPVILPPNANRNKQKTEGKKA